MTTVTSHDPRTGAVVGTVRESTPADVDAAVRAAVTAAPVIAAAAPVVRRRWLGAVADALVDHLDELVRLADAETALGVERLTGEVHRTAGQLRFYAEVAVEGSYLGLTEDTATATTPGIVRVRRPLGPVAVFGASNFPFAFGILGNDTASALAAGCPVVAKAHPAHAGLCERLDEITVEALRAAGAPAGAFALVRGFAAGSELVSHPGVAAVGFTGSQAGGLALWRAAQARPVAIPVYAEMGTVNPVVVTRAAAASDLEAIATGFVGSFTLGAGQLCTKPGLLLVPAGSGGAALVGRALESAAPAPVMLTEQIAAQVRAGIDAFRGAGATVVAELSSTVGWGAPAAVLAAPADALVPDSPLVEECFGAVALVVEYADDADLAELLGRLQGCLAAGVFAAEDDPDGPAYLRLLEPLAGRLLVNGWPTGVAVGWAQQHGGPWPATSDPTATSVGAGALDRFVRPVAYQSAPESWLPPEARAGGDWAAPRRVDGVLRPGGPV